MKVPFLDLGAQHQPIREEILAAWTSILDNTSFAAGRGVRDFEEAFAAAHDVDHAIAVATGTDALYVILKGLGVGPGDEVVLPANTFIATAGAVTMTGATPRLVDCLLDTKNIDPNQAAAALRLPKVRGVIGVHLYGQPADMNALHTAAGDRQFVVEDAAQAHLADHRGQPVGSLGAAAGFSFYPGKNLGAPGEGGAITTNDDRLADFARSYRDHGQREKYRSVMPGYNGRMHELVGVTLNIKLRYLAEWTAQRRRVAERYCELLGDAELVTLPVESEWARSSYHLFVVHVPNRDKVVELMRKADIGVGLHYPVPIHLQPAYLSLGHGQGDFPVAEESARTLLSLPMYGELTDEQIIWVAESLKSAVQSSSRHHA